MCLPELMWCLMEVNCMPILLHKQLFSTRPMYTMTSHDIIFGGQFDEFCIVQVRSLWSQMEIGIVELTSHVGKYLGK